MGLKDGIEAARMPTLVSIMDQYIGRVIAQVESGEVSIAGTKVMRIMEDRQALRWSVLYLNVCGWHLHKTETEHDKQCNLLFQWSLEVDDKANRKGVGDEISSDVQGSIDEIEGVDIYALSSSCIPCS